jgi:hypothetical protein
MKLFSPDSAHWYQRDGVPLHSVPSAKGEPRPTTLRDARKLGLVPSVTNILGVIAKPELTAWLQEQAVMAALTLPRTPGESEDVFAKRVVADSLSTRDNAADFGTAFHRGAERVARSLEVDPAHPAAEWLRHYRDWFQANALAVHWTEKVLVHQEWGYAGTADLLMEHAGHGLTLVDFKTTKTQRVLPASTDGAQRTARPTQFKPYKSWCYQLAAYRQALGQPVKCMNLIVNSVEPSLPIEHVWSEGEVARGWAAFEAARRLWGIEKNYEPSAECGVRNAELEQTGENIVVTE